MTQDVNADQVAGALHVSIGLLVRRLRQMQTEGELTMPEMSALARLDRGGPATSSKLAKLDQISPQSMGATLGALEARGLIKRSSDPEDKRRVVMSVTKAGEQVLHERRNKRAKQLAHALSTDFTDAELQQLSVAAPLIERLAGRL